MRWLFALRKFAKHAAIVALAVMGPEVVRALSEAGCVSGVDWLTLVDRSGAAALSALLGGALGAGANAYKHRARAPP